MSDYQPTPKQEQALREYLHEAVVPLIEDVLVKKLGQAMAFLKEQQQPEQEPLGEEWVPCVKLPIVVHVRNQKDGETHISTREGITPVLPEDLIMRGVAGEEYPIGRELFERTYTFNTAPPKREWVGLTDEDKDELLNLDNWTDIVEAVESKLKEKNT